MKRVHLTLLGGLTAILDGQEVDFPTRKSAALLAFLAVEEGRRRSRARLSDLLWSRSGDEQGRQSLRQAMFNVRKALGDLDPFEIEDDYVSIRSDLVSSDISELRSLAASGASPQRMTELARGEFLEGFELDEPPFDQWLAARRTELREITVQSYLEILAHQTEQARDSEAITTALALLELDPLNESVHRTLMRLYQYQGRTNAAIRQYRSLAESLRNQLRAEPQPETTRIYEQILEDRSIDHAEIIDPGLREPPHPEGSRVMVVEDVELQRRLITGILEEAGYTVIEAETGAEALLEMGRCHCDLILLDLNLPIVGGIDILEVVRQREIKAPVIVVSAERPELVEAKALELGAVDFIRKPVDRKTLLLRVERALGRERE